MDDGRKKLEPTARTTLRRFPVRGSFDRATVYGILDKAPIVHIREYVQTLLPRKLRCAADYADRATLWTDLGVLARTFSTLLFRR